MLEKPYVIRGATHGRRLAATEKILCEIKINQITYSVTFIVASLSKDFILGKPWMVENDILMGFGNADGLYQRTPLAKIRAAEEDLLVASLEIEEELMEELPWFSKSYADVGDGYIEVDTFTVEIEVLPRELEKFARVFSKPIGKGKMVTTSGYEHVIDTGDERLPFRVGKIYPMSLSDNELLRKEIDELLAEGKIRPSQAATASPVFFVSKDGGSSRRLVIDYRKLNEITKSYPFPLPIITELLASIPEGSWFTKLDLRSAFHQIPVRKEDIYKTAFICSKGLFEWVTMPFGLKNAATSFQHFIQSLLDSFIGITAYCYLDDIVVFSPTRSKNIEDVKNILEVLSKNNLFLKMEKCLFFQVEIPFLGFHLTSTGITLQSSKVEAILKWPVPVDISSVRSLLGMASFYRRFLRNFTENVAPIQEIVSNNAFVWTPSCEAAFAWIKNSLSNYPFLCHFVITKKTLLETDASGFGIGAVLSQMQNDGRYHPIAFFSKKLDAHQRNYSTYERELLSIVESLMHWSYYLTGVYITILTDHDALRAFSKKVVDTSRLLKWRSILERFEYEIRYRPGRQNGAADALSRVFDNDPDVAERGDGVSTVLLPSRLSSEPFEEVRVYALTIEKLNENTVPVPSSYGVNAFAKVDNGLLVLIRESQRSFIKIGKEWKAVEGIWVDAKGKILVPNVDSALQRRILSFYHEGPLIHPGGLALYGAVSVAFYWKGVRKMSYDYATNCIRCQMYKASNLQKFGGLQAVPIIPKPFAQVHIDHIIMTGEFQTGLVVVCRFTKYMQCIPGYKKGLAENVCMQLDEFFSLENIGYPQEITLDNHRWFSSKAFKEWALKHDIKLHYTIGYHPQSNGQVERFNSSFKTKLKLFLSENEIPRDKWHEAIPNVVEAMNRTQSSVTGVVPHLAVFGEDAPGEMLSLHGVDRIEELYRIMEEKIKASQLRAKAQHDAKRQSEKSFKVGDPVLLDLKATEFSQRVGAGNMVLPSHLGPFRVESVINDKTYTLTLPPIWVQYSKHLKNVFSSDNLIPFKHGKDLILPEQPTVQMGDSRVIVHKVTGKVRDATIFELPRRDSQVVIKNDAIPSSCRELLEAYETSLPGTKRKGHFITLETPENWAKRFKQ